MKPITLKGCRYLGGEKQLQPFEDSKVALEFREDGVTMTARLLWTKRDAQMSAAVLRGIEVSGAEGFTRDVSGVNVGGWGMVDSGKAKLSSVSYLSIQLGPGREAIFQINGINQMKLRAQLLPWWNQIQASRG